MTSNPIYRVLLNGHLICETTWAPMAQVAWARASTERNAAQHGGLAVIEKSGRRLAAVQPATGNPAAWPDPDASACTLHDVAKSLTLLLKQDGWDSRELADAVTELGLPTSRARIDSLRGSTQGKRALPTPAELVVLMHAVINEYKRCEA